MYELVLASLLFHTAAGTALLLMAAGVAALDLSRRRATGTVFMESHDLGTVVDLPTAIRAPRRVARVDADEQSEAA